MHVVRCVKIFDKNTKGTLINSHPSLLSSREPS